MTDLTKLGFYSQLNYLKKSDELSGSQSLSFNGSNLQQQTVTVEHNLGYIPFHTVAANLQSPDIIWMNNTDPQVTGSPIFEDVTLYYWCSNTTLTIILMNNDVTPITGNRTVYWNIYLDYGT